MRAAWLTDPHLNFLDRESRRFFEADLQAVQADAILLGGDVAEGPEVAAYLEELAVALQPATIYFVLGNHDFYRSSFATVDAAVRGLTAANLIYLTHAAGPIPLAHSTVLVGDDGWADGRVGDYRGSRIVLNDYILIQDFQGLDRLERLRLMHRLGDAAAARLAKKLAAACSAGEGATPPTDVVVLTHVPPFREACWHEGAISDSEWLPHFTCRAVGDALLAAADAHPSVRFLVLCGHTHSGGIALPRPNLTVKTGGAVYGFPKAQEVFDFR